MRYADSLTCTAVPKRLSGVPPVEWSPGLIFGPAGVGKSYLAAGMARRVGATWINASRFLDDCRWAATVNLDVNGDSEGWRALKSLEEGIPFVKYLVVDDVAVEKPSEFSLSRLYDLFETRWSEELETVVTANLPPGDLAGLLGDRIVSRILGCGTPREMSGRDRRVV